ncbi:hypothetical protein U1Q18_052466 [Sarracenia purpurea var. burkii]
MTHELNKKGANADDGKKKKDIALKASTKKNKSREESSSEEDEHMAHLTRQFKNFLKNKKGGRRFFKKEGCKWESSKHKEKSSSKEEEYEDVTCYKCHKLGHIKQNCPFLMKKDKRKHQKRTMKVKLT